MTDSKTCLATAVKCIASIDFGTSRSGLAYGLVSDPKNIFVVSDFHEEKGNVKARSCLLLDENNNFVAFGQQAINIWLELNPIGIFFDSPKMSLYNSIAKPVFNGQRRREACREAESDCVAVEEMDAQAVLQHVFQFFAKTLQKHLERHEIQSSEVKWVLSVPAIWADAAKQIMLTAAVDAQLARSPCDIVLSIEPEAAALYCLQQRQELNVDHLQMGSTFIVLDCGGGTVDTTVHRLIRENKLKEVLSRSGGAWGSKFIDEGFLKVLDLAFGAGAAMEFEHHCPFEFEEMKNHFEAVKLSFHREERTVSRRLRLPQFTQMYLEHHCHTPVVSPEAKAMGIEFTNRGMLVLPGPVLEKLIQDQVDPILAHVEEMLLTVPETDILFLCGGMSESPLLVQNLQTKFAQHVTIVHPPRPTLAVLIGSVHYGLAPTSIFSRVASMTLGINLATEFIQGYHDGKKKYRETDGKHYCDTFFPLIVKDSIVECGKCVTITTYPVLTSQSWICYTIFSTFNKNFGPDPTYADDPQLTKIGQFEIYTPPSRKVRSSIVSFDLGGTFLKAHASCATSATSASLNIDCYAKR